MHTEETMITTSSGRVRTTLRVIAATIAVGLLAGACGGGEAITVADQPEGQAALQASPTPEPEPTAAPEPEPEPTEEPAPEPEPTVDEAPAPEPTVEEEPAPEPTVEEEDPVDESPAATGEAPFEWTPTNAEDPVDQAIVAGSRLFGRTDVAAAVQEVVPYPDLPTPDDALLVNFRITVSDLATYFTIQGEDTFSWGDVTTFIDYITEADPADIAVLYEARAASIGLEHDETRVTTASSGRDVTSVTLQTPGTSRDNPVWHNVWVKIFHEEEGGAYVEIQTTTSFQDDPAITGAITSFAQDVPLPDGYQTHQWELSSNAFNPGEINLIVSSSGPDAMPDDQIEPTLDAWLTLLPTDTLTPADDPRYLYGSTAAQILFTHTSGAEGQATIADIGGNERHRVEISYQVELV